MSRGDVDSYLGGEEKHHREIGFWLGWRLYGCLSTIPFSAWGGQNLPSLCSIMGTIRESLRTIHLLSVLAETGIFGFFCFSAIIVISFKQLLAMRRWWMRKPGSEHLLVLCNGVLVSLVGFLVNSSVSVKDHDPIYWIVLTFAAILTRFYRNELKLGNYTLKGNCGCKEKDSKSGIQDLKMQKSRVDLRVSIISMNLQRDEFAFKSFSEGKRKRRFLDSVRNLWNSSFSWTTES